MSQQLQLGGAETSKHSGALTAASAERALKREIKEIKAVQEAIPGHESSYSGCSLLHQAAHSSSNVPCRSGCPFAQQRGQRAISSHPPGGLLAQHRALLTGVKEWRRAFGGLSACVRALLSCALSPLSLPTTCPQSPPFVSSFPKASGERSEGATEPHQVSSALLKTH